VSPFGIRSCSGLDYIGETRLYLTNDTGVNPV
jgi:hypothetical protein